MRGAARGAATSCRCRFGEVRINGNEEHLAGVDARGPRPVVHLDVDRGTLRGTLAEDEILVSEREAEGYELRLGDPITVDVPAVGPQSLTRRRQSTRTELPRRLFPIRLHDQPAAVRRRLPAAPAGLVRARERASRVRPDGAWSRAADRALAEPFPNIDVRTQAGYKDAQESELDQFLNVFIALLLLSEVIAVLGIVNTLFLSIYERTREVGLLRTVGMTRRQVWRMVCGESVIITVIGCVLGLLDRPAVGLGA